MVQIGMSVLASVVCVMNNDLGKLGEEQAVQYLMRKGYQIIGRNWRCSHGEIDIIAQDQRGMVFVEVKTRRLALEQGWEAITPKKRQRMIDSAYAYMNAHNIDDKIMWRIDVIVVQITRGQITIEHGEDALGW
jgi:putative endonuclease